MWLINTTTLRLEFVLKPESQPYAILSHTWEEEEVTFQEMANLEMAQKKKGFMKIKKTCQLAQERQPPLLYAWVDTCCIDKTSSVELAEAINSMFAWYKKATVCFAFLSDFTAHEPVNPDPLLPHCRWFTRGWTLQELIAPKIVEFYDSVWNPHGTKSERRDEIADITGVASKVLDDSDLLHNVSVGARMSWASGRQTSRDEDMAYCLLGIFNVNMVMIYGEGAKAFIRLQEEIMKDSNDMTLFAWCSDDSSQLYRGILARSPSEFEFCRDVVRSDDFDTMNKEYMLTNNGLRIETNLAKDNVLEIGLLDRSHRLGIGTYLRKTPNGFVRHGPPTIYFLSRGDYRQRTGKQSTIYIRKDITAEDSKLLKDQLDCNVKVLFRLSGNVEVNILRAHPSPFWDRLSYVEPAMGTWDS
ncbi:Vegetative incompatibility protein HET-E-1 [Cytospora mali]|uniref:Vegetative incompatibility protein HET-E-1 n=1 Tax=Cytospora mali TaxID=578113 RepID=A0A194VUG1_CYTMA|nr:Vegetative incompatibility protein HET-E-1 [Valsa mali]